MTEKNLQEKSMIHEIIGWYGTIAIIAAYAGNSFNFIATNSFAYQLLNFTGAIGIITISLHKKVYQSVALNIVWGLVAIVAIVGIVMH